MFVSVGLHIQALYKCYCAIFQYQMDTEQLSETLTKLNNSLDPKSISKKSNSETLLQLEVGRGEEGISKKS